MKSIAQALTFRELDAIRSTLVIILQHKEQIPLETETMIAAFKKVDRAIDDMRYQQCDNTYFLIIPVGLEEITEEQ